MIKDILYYAEKSKATWNISVPDNIYKYYLNKEIDKEYALYLLSLLIEKESSKHEKELMQKELYQLEKYYNKIHNEALTIYCKIHPKNKELFEYIKNIIISDDKVKLNLLSVILLYQYFPKKAKDVINYYLDKNPRIIDYFTWNYASCHEEYFLAHKLGEILEFPIVKLYLYYNWFFDKHKFIYNNYQKRIFGHFDNFHGNLEYKLQSQAGTESIYSQTTNTEFLFEFSYEDILKRDKFIVDLSTRYSKKFIKVINIKDINKKYCFGISYSFFRKVIKIIKKLFKLESDDFFMSFIRNQTVYFLYIDIPSISLEILLPARRVKR